MYSNKEFVHQVCKKEMHGQQNIKKKLIILDKENKLFRTIYIYIYIYMTTFSQ